MVVYSVACLVCNPTIVGFSLLCTLCSDHAHAQFSCASGSGLLTLHVQLSKESVSLFTGRRPAAIVSPVAGTTRDVIEITLNVAGYPVVISDTAGLRQTSDHLELEGVRRAIKRYYLV